MKPARGIPKISTKPGLLSTLPKVWHKFLVLKDFAILNGHYSQSHKKYKGRNLQSSSICVIACAIAKLNKAENWSQQTLDEILQLGTDLYAKTMQVLNNKCLGILKPPQIYKYFFLADLKITMSVGVDTVQDKLTRETNYKAILQERLNKFLALKQFGIFVCQDRFFAVWKLGEDYFMFDPVEHELDGAKWLGIPGLGYCYCMKFTNAQKMADVLISNISVKQITRYTIYPCLIEKVVKVDTTPPESVTTRQGKIPDVPVTKLVGGKDKKALPKVVKVEKKLEDGIPLSKVPPERPKIKSETKFAGIPGTGDGKCGILRASTHQKDPKFTRYLGAQELSNAVAALTMLRVYKAKEWNTRRLDHALKLGEWIHHESKKLDGPAGQITDKVQLGEKCYAPHIKKFGTIGMLGSRNPDVWDLRPALTNFFAEFDCCILNGPYIVAIWLENGLYYMFDPNERDNTGRTNKNQAGVACVTWYDNVKSLADTYMSNVPVNQKTERFFLSEVKIKDYKEVPGDWNNFRALTVRKWILRGNFSQSDYRFKAPSRGVQCTANATMSLTFAKLKDVTGWGSETLDEILTRGDELYRRAVAILEEKGAFKHRLLMVDEIPRNFPLDNKQIDLEIYDCKVNGVINGEGFPEFPNLAGGVKLFFDECEAGVVTACGQSFGVFKKDGAYFYFDSHSRNENGMPGYGTCCILRHTNIEDLVESLLSNIGSCRENAYNLSMVNVRLIEQTEDGMIKPPLNNLTEINDCVAIIRASSSQMDEKYGLNRDRQTVPNCLAAVAFNQLNQADVWGKQELDQILDLGDKLYFKTMEDMDSRSPEDIMEPEESEDGVVITTSNVKKEIKIGKNKFYVDFEEFGRGNFEESLKAVLETLLPEVPPDEEVNVDPEEEGDEFIEPKPKPQPEANNFQLILESPLMTVSMWKEGHMIYLFDPRPRDENGQIYGKDEWSVKIEEPIEDFLQGVDNEYEDGDEEEEGDDPDEGAKGDYEEEPQEEIFEDDQAFAEPPVDKKGQEFWTQKESEEGKSCLIRFCRLSHLIDHLLENTPPTQRDQMEFILKTVKLDNKPIAKAIFDPEVDEKKDEIVGDWYSFKEVDYGKWSLRGLKNLTDEMYLPVNRGKQQIPCCLNALAFAKFYALSKFKSSTLDHILSYGDKLLTFVRRLRLKELKMNKDLGLSEEECEEIVKTLSFALPDYPNKFCIQQKLVTTDIKFEAVVGDCNSKIPNEIPDLKVGVKKFFETHEFGVMECRHLLVAIWKDGNVFYMFDCQPRGPSGVKSPTGVPCITRFLNSDSLVRIYKTNLPKYGEGFFVIHHVGMIEGVCPRERQPEEVIVKPPKLGGFQPVVPGRFILRGDLKQDFNMFDRGVHAQSSAIAFVALTMSLVQKPETWTKLIVNDILEVGNELYNDTIEKMGQKYNPYTHKLDIYTISNDFKVGSLTANTALRYMEQRGVVDIRLAKIPNLRQGLERFFEENSHGILRADKLVLAVWEEEREGQETCIYLFDPNPRGSTGLPSTGGLACCMKFCNAVAVADHVMSCLTGVDKARTEYSIVPVEIVVGAMKSCRKKKKESPCDKEKREKKELEEKTKGVCAVVTNVVKSPCKEKAKKNIPVTCPSKCVAVEQKQTLRRIADEDRKKQEAKRLALLGRSEWYKINDGESLVRSFKAAKENRDLATCVAAFVMLKTTNLDRLTVKNMESILQCGEQLYTDSYTAYNPTDKQLGLENVLRRFFIKELEAKISVYKPMPATVLNPEYATRYMNKYFVKYNICLLNYQRKWVTLLLKGGYYYYFDPYGRSLDGNRDLTPRGSAIVMKFGDLQGMMEKVCGNLKEVDDDGSERFKIVMVVLQEVKPK